MVKIIENINYSIDGPKIVEYLGEHRTVIIKNKEPVQPETIISFYKTLGNVIQQNDKVTGTIATGELVKVRQNGLFAGKEDGELEWHSAGMNRKIGRDGAEDIVAMYMNKPSETGGDTYFSDFQTAYEDFEDKDKVKDLQSEMRNYSDERSLKAKHYEKVFNDEQTYRSFKDIDGIEAHKKELKTKPLITKHPINNKEGFYYPWVVIRGFEGLEKRKAHRTYFEIKKHVMGEKYVYRHKWDDYDICLSDQHHSLHRRDKYEGDRELWRAGIWVR